MLKKIVKGLLRALCIVYTYLEKDEDEWLMPIYVGDLPEEYTEYSPTDYLKL